MAKKKTTKKKPAKNQDEKHKDKLSINASFIDVINIAVKPKLDEK